MIGRTLGAFALLFTIFHPKSKTAIVADLIQQFQEDQAHGWWKGLLKMDGLFGPSPTTPRALRLSFMFGKEQTRKVRDVILNDWKPENLILAHAECVVDGRASEVISNAFSWLDKFHDCC